jgi:hypothetical protein
MKISPRSLGEPTLPFVRVESNFRLVDAEIRAIDLRTEAGYGLLGFQYNTSQYQDNIAHDTLVVSEQYCLYRMTIASGCEMDLGLGQLTLSGNGLTTVQSSATIPLLIHPVNTHLGLEFRPAWSDGVQDFDAAVLYSAHFASFKAGYRWMNSPHESLHGPYLGVAFHL